MAMDVHEWAAEILRQIHLLEIERDMTGVKVAVAGEMDYENERTEYNYERLVMSEGREAADRAYPEMVS